MVALQFNRGLVVTATQASREATIDRMGAILASRSIYLTKPIEMVRLCLRIEKLGQRQSRSERYGCLFSWATRTGGRRP